MKCYFPTLKVPFVLPFLHLISKQMVYYSNLGFIIMCMGYCKYSEKQDSLLPIFYINSTSALLIQQRYKVINTVRIQGTQQLICMDGESPKLKKQT